MKTNGENALVPVTDGIDGHTSTVVGGKPRKAGVLQGEVFKFTKAGNWETRDGEPVSPNRRFVLTNAARVLSRWGKDKMPLETIVLGPGEPWPPHEDWNNQLDKSEWVEGPKGLQGPWQPQQILYLLDQDTGAVACFPTSTVGASIALEQLIDAVKGMRMYRPGASPVIGLSSKVMKTRKWGPVPRPHFSIYSWVTPERGEPAQAALPVPEAHAAPAAPSSQEAKAIKPPKARQSRSRAFGNEVKPVSLAEELNDEVPFLG